MGHLGHLKEEYRQLVERLDANPVGLPEPKTEEARQGWQEILEILFTPEDAALAARMPVAPSKLEKIASRVGMKPSELRTRLDSLADRGIVLDLVHPETGDVRYLLAPPVVGFFEFSMMRAKDSIPKKRMAKALEAYTHGDDTFARDVFGGDTVIGRTMVHETALRDDSLPDVLDWERATSVVGDARVHAVSLCYCRHKKEHLGQRCDAPMDVCLSLNGGAEFVIRRGFGRKVAPSEAMDILVESRESGLVQIADNVQHRPTYVCNCCGCCCGQLSAINDFDLPAVNPSGFVALSDREKCNGCSRCARACPVTAIAMDGVRISAKRKNRLAPRVDADRCIGCGVCVAACRRSAMAMERRKERPRVPWNVIEKSLRMAMERGRLPHLLFDVGQNRGMAFLNKTLQAICRLPLMDRLLASEQLRSRFVKFAIKNIPDPTG